MPDTPPDRRSALKQRSRSAIITAATELMAETGGTTFSVDKLAGRADVSRRTIFNHFDSLDDVVAEVCSGVLRKLIDNVAEPMARTSPQPGASIFDELTAVLRSTDLVGPMAYLTRTLGGGEGPGAPWRADLLQRALQQVGLGLVDALQQRHPEAEPLDLHLLVGAVTAGVLVLHLHWWQRTGARDDEASRAAWSELLDHLLSQLRSGFGTFA